MRLYSLLFALVVIVVAVLMLANAGTLLKTTTVALPLLGDVVAPVRLIGLLALIALAGVYSLAWSVAATRSQARSVQDLRKLEDLRRSLDKEEANRFAALRLEIDRQFHNVLEKLERVPNPALAGGKLAALPGQASIGQTADTDRLLLGVNARVDRVRDELAADIGAVEDNILRALARFDPDAKIIQADRPPKRLP